MAVDLADIRDRLEKAEQHDATNLPDAVAFMMQNRVGDGSDGPITVDHVKSSDAVLHLIDDVVPGWTIWITGKATEPNGQWRCTLRQSSSQDNDEFIGSGRGKVLSHALLSALLATIDYLSSRQ
ncbi:hypothetical protein [Pseudaestuariivita rosea]|uniref:hypothetical protein n=1 Tax=Pseudaestuariivita rosea TaxID=2763263 RepID=UPI001ABB2E80|nr:hypothetical protein [Pseudaestuariivita rosea]